MGAPRYRFFGGKGGVGKTTCAAAAAALLAREGARTLVLSTDPAHSLGDVFGRRLGPRPAALEGLRRLDGLELAADAALDRWLAPRRGTLAEIASRGTWLDREEASRILALSFPGVDELVALLEIARICESGAWDEVVVDTAPTGHALRMLAMPATLERLAGVLDRMQEKHRVIAAALGGRRGDAADALVDELFSDAERLTALLRDHERTSFHWVTAAERLALAEAEDGIRALREGGFSVAELIVNRRTPPSAARCGFCAARRREERALLDALPPVLREIPRREIEDRVPAGAPRRTPNAAAHRGRDVRRRAATGTATVTRSGSGSGSRPDSGTVPGTGAGARAVTGAGTRLVLVGGKGGTGKSTVAATLALELARENPRERVLVLSIDPAHSLGDALAQALSSRDSRVVGGPPNLVARELDAPAAFAALRDRYREAVDDLFDRLRGGSRFDASFDRAIVKDLLDLAPPGLDEIFGVLSLVEALGLGENGPAGARFDRVVVDTAPTAHAIRLLEMPERAAGWVKTLLEVLRRWQGALRGSRVTQDLVGVARGLRLLRETLADRSRTGFVVVTRAEPVVIDETRRLLASLARARIHASAVFFNALSPRLDSRCDRCAATAIREAEAMGALDAPLPAGCAIIHAPRIAPAPRGAAALAMFRAGWRTAASAAGRETARSKSKSTAKRR